MRSMVGGRASEQLALPTSLARREEGFDPFLCRA